MPNKPQPRSDERFNSDSKLKLDTAHDVVTRPDKFAELFCNAAKTQLPIREELTTQMLTLLKTDPAARAEIMILMRQVFAEDWREFVRSKGGRLLSIIGAILLVALGAVLQAVMSKYIK